MLDVLQELKFDKLVLDAIKVHKTSPTYIQTLDKLLSLLALVAGINQKVKINITTFIELWEMLGNNSSAAER